MSQNRRASGGNTSRVFDRRHFLALSGAGAAAWLITKSRGSALGYAANERLGLAVVGVAGYCAATAFMPGAHLYENTDIVALCDVDQRKVAPALKLWEERAAGWPNSPKSDERAAAATYRRLVERRPPLFEDYRVMLEKMGGAIDAVVVATPDHTHAVASAAALRAGKHVLCEKPLTIRVEEARRLRALAAERRVATSVGTQGMQSSQFRRGVELVREGVIGPVEQVHLWFARGGANLKQPPQGAQSVPKELNWDLWLGPVAWREYNAAWIARTYWRDTSAGQLGNFGPHTGNLAAMALRVTDLWLPPCKNSVAGGSVAAGATSEPIRVEAECPDVNRLSFPVWERIAWHVPARGAMPPVRITWHHGPDYAPGARSMLETLLRDHGTSDEDVKKWLGYAGMAMVGDKGLLVSNSHNTEIALLPAGRFEGIDTRALKTLPASRGHYHDWILACRGEAMPLGRFEYAATYNELLMLGDVATRFPGESLEYDPAAGRITNHAEADAALGCGYRPGWEL